MTPIETVTLETTTSDGSKITVTGELFDSTIIEQGSDKFNSRLTFKEGNLRVGQWICNLNNKEDLSKCVSDFCDNIDEVLPCL